MRDGLAVLEVVLRVGTE
jgi:hypothetical protein